VAHESGACVDHPSTARSIRAAVQALARGEMVVVADDEQRENEADLIMAAEFATAESVAFMVAKTTGILCVPMHGERLDQLRLPLMTDQNTEAHATAFTISVDHTSTGTCCPRRIEPGQHVHSPIRQPSPSSCVAQDTSSPCATVRAVS
jgi:hypothetical protein